jgi:hypothetical protein
MAGYRAVATVTMLVDAPDPMAAATMATKRLSGAQLADIDLRAMKVSVTQVIPEVVAMPGIWRHHEPHFFHGICGCTCPECGADKCICPAGCEGSDYFHQHD